MAVFTAKSWSNCMDREKSVEINVIYDASVQHSAQERAGLLPRDQHYVWLQFLEVASILVQVVI